MATTIIIITFCVLLIIAYIFDLTSTKTKIPSVILLLGLGFSVKQVVLFLGLHLPNFTMALPIIGTLGLILIVLEGSLGLELNKSKIRPITTTMAGATLPMIASAFVIVYFFKFVEFMPWRIGLLNVIPICIISSAIAIPSIRNLGAKNKEFVIYESSFSDIIGVLVFTYVAANSSFTFLSFGKFDLELLIMIIVSFIASLGLSYLLSHIKHHIKFIPITLLVILIYSISKIYHLPALVFILIFGLFLGNLNKFAHYKWFARFKPHSLSTEIHKFKELTIEAAFLIRSLFFLLFGYLLETAEILNTHTILWAIAIIIIIYAFRAAQLFLSGKKLTPLVYIAPRGLITILLFLTIDPDQHIKLVNKSLIIQIIILSSFIMMYGLMIKDYQFRVSKRILVKRISKKKEEEKDPLTELINNTNIESNEEIINP